MAKDKSTDQVAVAEKEIAAKVEIDVQEQAAEEQTPDATEQATTEIKATKETAIVEKVASTTTQKLAEKYRKSYPNCKIFYITSDMQVFLNDSYNMALLHQKSLKSGELETVKF